MLPSHATSEGWNKDQWDGTKQPFWDWRLQGVLAAPLLTTLSPHLPEPSAV